MGGDTGVVVIGRNEGERLERCLASTGALPTVYVDSGSSDGSPESARAQGVEVVELDPSRPFSAGRARNEGFEHLLRIAPTTRYVQFVDGDCELDPGWIEAGRAALEARPEVAVAFGRRRERHPEASLYNRLADLEWQGRAGEVEACGGDALVRAEAFRAVGGFDRRLIAGEEPELCLRLRRRGFRILRLEREMTRHEAGLERFSQWWRRQKRAGHAFAESAWLHGSEPERFRVREAASILAWSLGLPGVVVLLTAGGASPAPLALLAAYPLLAARIAWRRSREGHAADAFLYAGACVLGKFAGLAGVLAFARSRLGPGGRTALIEYKGAGDGARRE